MAFDKNLQTHSLIHLQPYTIMTPSFKHRTELGLGHDLEGTSNGA